MANTTDSKDSKGSKIKVVKYEYCSMCGKPHSDFEELVITGKAGSICKSCALRCSDMYKEIEAANKFTAIKVPSPPEIKAFLDQYVIGQERTKKVLSVAVHNHYSRITSHQGSPMPEVELEKSNVLLIGSTGVGKTLLAQTIARMLNVPCAISDATTLTEAGYVGSDPENILLKLYQAAGSNIGAAEMGIVVLDEIDKKAKKDSGVSITRDVSGEGVQSALLKIIEGSVADVPLSGGRKHPNAEIVKIDTKNILFVLCGSFDGLDKIVSARVKGKGALGFDIEDLHKDELNSIEPEDLVAFGLIPELVGRIPVVSRLASLNEKDLVRILSEPKNAVLRQYEKLAMLDNASLVFEEDAKLEIAKVAFERGTGARGLRAVVENLLLDVMYNLKAGDKITITKKMVRDSTGVNSLSGLEVVESSSSSSSSSSSDGSEDVA